MHKHRQTLATSQTWSLCMTGLKSIQHQQLDCCVHTCAHVTHTHAGRKSTTVSQKKISPPSCHPHRKIHWRMIWKMRMMDSVTQSLDRSPCPPPAPALLMCCISSRITCCCRLRSAWVVSSCILSRGSKSSAKPSWVSLTVLAPLPRVAVEDKQTKSAVEGKQT